MPPSSVYLRNVGNFLPDCMDCIPEDLSTFFKYLKIDVLCFVQVSNKVYQTAAVRCQFL